MTTRQLHLNAFLMSTGHHEASWRLPESDPYAHVDLAHYVHLARIAERGTFDSLFLADGPQLWNNLAQRPAGALEPLTLLTALATATEHIGLIATASTSYNSPYNLARKFASLDIVSGGRAGWNIVTTAGAEAARNFGLAAEPAHAERYARAAEFLDVAQKLWDSWEDDAVVADKAAGVWGDDTKIHPPRHEGRYFSVAGALNVPRTPQGYPLLVQAGSSEDGKRFAARYAEAVFTAQQTIEDARAFYADLKSRTAEAGRDPGHIKVLPGIVPVIGSTEAEALAAERVLEDHIVYTHGVNRLENLLQLEPGTLELDGRLPDLPPESAIGGAQSCLLYTPEQVADAIETWFTQGAADGFNIMPAVLPSGLDAFVDHVVPILRARGLLRREYGPRRTLRERYGLPRPANQYVTPALARA
ncbi:LLM class flavin-dependent oxidoreductase [Streptomyces resistomycificus]|uniref:LLM class flavin-dependent oxidoreductase n=1 Tax=Streptomyces resistomycificus TaxID=67356 RepID=UPI0004AA3840|nr:LLM class flavin-dependent oxidoreductase [Streptomyces resistomycificus]